MMLFGATEFGHVHLKPRALQEGKREHEEAGKARHGPGV